MKMWTVVPVVKANASRQKKNLKQFRLVGVIESVISCDNGTVRCQTSKQANWEVVLLCFWLAFLVRNKTVSNEIKECIDMKILKCWFTNPSSGSAKCKFFITMEITDQGNLLGSPIAPAGTGKGYAWITEVKFMDIIFIRRRIRKEESSGGWKMRQWNRK